MTLYYLRSVRGAFLCVMNPSELFCVAETQNEGSDEVLLCLGMIPEWFHHQTSQKKKTIAVLTDFNLNIMKAPLSFPRFPVYVSEYILSKLFVQ